MGEKIVLTVAVGMVNLGEAKGLAVMRPFLRAQPEKFFREDIFRVTEELDKPFCLRKVWYLLMVWLVICKVGPCGLQGPTLAKLRNWLASER